MDDHEDGVVAAFLETAEFRRTVSSSIGQPPGRPDEADLHHDRDRWVFNAILNMVGSEVPDRLMRQPGAVAIDVLSRISPRAPNSRPQEDLVAALLLAVNEALSGSPGCLERFLPSDPTVEKLLQLRGAANDMASEPARLYLRFLYSAILIRAAAGKTLKWSIRQRPLTALPNWRFARVREYVNSHIDEPIRLRDLAKVAGLSRMHFAAQFRANTGISPGVFVLTQRIRHAQVLLRDPRKTLVDVTLSVGFRTQAHFTTVFRRYVGDTPGCWRKAISREEQSGVSVEIPIRWTGIRVS
jgi:AraC-like DNA-binding protein